MNSNLVSTAELETRLNAPNLVVVDASWHLPATKRNARSEFELQHIPNARFYDLDAGAANDTPLPHMLPAANKFAADIQSLGIGSGASVVVYDAAGLFSAARFWWMLKSFGFANVAVLDGGLPKWQRENRPLSSRTTPVQHVAAVNSNFNLDQWKSMADVASATQTGRAQILDARSPARFRGEEPEPRAGVKPGHMPGAINLHYATLLNADGTFKQGEALRSVLVNAQVNLNEPIITSCGSGVTAAILSLALTELGAASHALYDGSWAEWGASSNPVVTG